MSGLVLKNVNKSFDGKPVLKSINLELAEGELVVLLGPSGCGKSTLLRIIAGLETADSGEIHVSNFRIDQKEPKDRNVALVFQNYALYPHMTVEKNLSFPLRILKTPAPEIKRKVQDVAQLLGLSDKLHDRPGKLSGGERQRVALGRAIIREPAIFLLDEPLSNLDADLRGRMRREIVALQKRIKKTLIHVTHDQTEALTMADRIVLMNKGEIVQIGTPPELYQSPVDLFTAKFIGYPPVNTVNSKVSDGIILPLGLPITYLPRQIAEQEFVLAIRAEDIIIDKDGILAGTIESIEYLGGQMLIRIVTGGTMLTALTLAKNLELGQTVKYNFSIERLEFFSHATSKRLSSENRQKIG